MGFFNQQGEWVVLRVFFKISKWKGYVKLIENFEKQRKTNMEEKRTT